MTQELAAAKAQAANRGKQTLISVKKKASQGTSDSFETH
jgi:hypothetical protein